MAADSLIITATIAIIAQSAFGFQPHPLIQTRKKNNDGGLRIGNIHYLNFPAKNGNKNIPSTKLQMVRNVDLPEALVFYGFESIMESPIGRDTNADTADEWKLRPGIARILNECQEVGTAALFLSEAAPPFSLFSTNNGNMSGDENSRSKYDHQLQVMFEKGWEKSFTEMKISSPKDPALPTFNNGNAKEIVKNTLSFRCPQSTFSTPISKNDVPEDGEDSIEDDTDNNYQFYNLGNYGRSPSPGFLMDSLHSIHIDPRGFGGSSGFGRGQWIEPRRSPMPARTVVFIAGDWIWNDNDNTGETNDEKEDVPSVKTRCAAARAAGCRIIYLEQQPPLQQDENSSSCSNKKFSIREDFDTMSLCDAVITTFGNDNPRDLNPITLDAISTPGEYWLNPPNPRDDSGNAVVVDDVVEWFRLEREMEEALGDGNCVVGGGDAVGGGEEDTDADVVVVEEMMMSDEEIDSILADLDGF